MEIAIGLGYMLLIVIVLNFVDKRLGIGDKLIENNRIIKSIIFIGAIVLLNAILSGYIESYYRTFIFYTIQGFFIYFLMLITNKR
jgi:hypothetical protein